MLMHKAWLKAEEEVMYSNRIVQEEHCYHWYEWWASFFESKEEAKEQIEADYRAIELVRKVIHES